MKKNIKKKKTCIMAALCAVVTVMAVLLTSTSVYASQFGSEVAVILKYINSATGEEVKIGLRGYDSDGNSVLRQAEPVVIDESDDSFLDPENAAKANFQVDGGDKEPADWTERLSQNLQEEDGTLAELRFIRSGHYYLDSETSTWTADTVITISDVEIPEGYTEDNESGIYQVTFGQKNYEKVQDILNGTIEDDGEAIYIYVPIYISDGSEPIAAAEASDETTGHSNPEDVSGTGNDDASEAALAENDTAEETAAAADSHSGSSTPSLLLPIGAVILIILLLLLFFRRRKVNK